MALTQAEFQNIAATQGAQGVFEAAKSAGMSLEQLAQVGGVSTQEMANLAQSQGISTEQLGQIGWSSPTPAAPTSPAPTKEYFQQLASTGGAQAVFDYAKKAGLNMEQLAKVGGVSQQELADLAQSQGFNIKLLGDIGYNPDVYTGNTGDKPIHDPSRGWGTMLQPGTKEYNDYLTNNMLSFKAQGFDPRTVASSGGKIGPNFNTGSRISSPYSSAFAAHNSGGGGLAWAESIGGWNGYLKGMLTDPDYLDKLGLNQGALDIYKQENQVAASMPVYDPNTGTYRAPKANSINPAFLGNQYGDMLVKSPLEGGAGYYNFDAKGNPVAINGGVGGQGGQGSRYGSVMSPSQQPAPYRPPQGYSQQPINQQSRMGNIGYGGYGGGGYGGYGGYGGRQSMYPYQNYGRQGSFGGYATSRQPYTGYQAYQPYGGNYRNGMFGAPTMNYNMRNRPMQQYSQSWSQNNPYSFGGY